MTRRRLKQIVLVVFFVAGGLHVIWWLPQWLGYQFQNYVWNALIIAGITIVVLSVLDVLDRQRPSIDLDLPSPEDGPPRKRPDENRFEFPNPPRYDRLAKAKEWKATAKPDAQSHSPKAESKRQTQQSSDNGAEQ
jgi:hypothetical protein